MKNSHQTIQLSANKNSFWNACPKKLEFFPETVCPLGKQAFDSKSEETGCGWAINSEVDNFCFWTWLRRRSDAEGFMEPVLQHEMASLLGSSGAKLHLAYREVLEKLTELPEFEDLKELFENSKR